MSSFSLFFGTSLTVAETVEASLDAFRGAITAWGDNMSALTRPAVRAHRRAPWRDDSAKAP
jgi:hypothetical protein